LIDCQKQYKGSGAAEFGKMTQRQFLFLNQEQVKFIEGKIREKEILKHNLSLARERAEDEIQ